MDDSDHLPFDLTEGRGASRPRPLLNMNRLSLLALAAQLETAAAGIRLLVENEGSAARPPPPVDPNVIDWLKVQWPPHPGLCDFSDRSCWITVGEAQTLLHLRSESSTRDRVRRRPVSVKVGGIIHVNRIRLLAPTGSLPGEDR